jgi:methionyl-tRNA formyltransferase
MESAADKLLTELAEDAAELLKTNLSDMLSGKAVPAPQDETLVTLAPKLKKEMARLDLTKDAAELHRQVRAFQPWPGAEFQLDKTIIKVLNVGKILNSDKPQGTLRWDKSGATLSVGGGSAIELITLQRSGKPAQPVGQVMQFWGARGSIALDV